MYFAQKTALHKKKSTVFNHVITAAAFCVCVNFLQLVSETCLRVRRSHHISNWTNYVECVLWDAYKPQDSKPNISDGCGRRAKIFARLFFLPLFLDRQETQPVRNDCVLHVRWRRADQRGSQIADKPINQPALLQQMHCGTLQQLSTLFYLKEHQCTSHLNLCLCKKIQFNLSTAVRKQDKSLIKARKTPRADIFEAGAEMDHTNKSFHPPPTPHTPPNLPPSKARDGNLAEGSNKLITNTANARSFITATIHYGYQ